MNINFVNFLNKEKIEFEESLSLKNKTWIKTGGIASTFVMQRSADQLRKVVSFLNENKITYEIIGHTSNLYYLDSYNPSVVISTRIVNHYDLHD